MTRYHFHIDNAVSDIEGLELSGPDEAEREAVLLAAEWLKDHPDHLVQNGALTIRLEDAAGLTLMHIEVVARRSAANRVARTG